MYATELLDKIGNNDNSYIRTYKKTMREDNEDVAALQEELTAFEQNVKKLKKYSPTSTIKFNLEKQLKGLVKSYNAMNKNAKEIKDEELHKQLSKLEDVFEKHAKKLWKIGFKQEKGKYKLETESFDKADKKIIEELFGRDGSFVKDAAKALRGVETRADETCYSIVKRKISRTTRFDADSLKAATGFVTCKSNVQKLTDNAETVENLMPGQTDIMQAIGTNLQDFCNSLNEAHDSWKDAGDKWKKIDELCASNADKLSDVGISYADGKLSYVDVADKSTGSFQSAYTELFGKNAAFARQTQKFCTDSFNSIIRPDKLGVSLIDMYL